MFARQSIASYQDASLIELRARGLLFNQDILAAEYRSQQLADMLGKLRTG